MTGPAAVGRRPARLATPTTTRATVLRALARVGTGTAADVAAACDRPRSDVARVLRELVRDGVADRLRVDGADLYAPTARAVADVAPCPGACAGLGIPELVTIGQRGCSRCGAAAVSA